MAKIFPFSGITYNKKNVGNLSKVIIPPYDIISKEEQERFYGVSPYNCIRLTLGKDFPADTEYNNKYTAQYPGLPVCKNSNIKIKAFNRKNIPNK